MTLIEGIGDEVIQFFIGLVVILVAALAWCTTSTSEHRNVQTVWLLDRRRHRAHRRLTSHTHSVTISEGTSTQAEASSTVTSATDKPPEASTSADSSSNEERSEDDERSQIVEAMDDDTYVLRQRRLAFYDRAGDTEETPSGSGVSKSEEKDGSEITIKLKYINDDLKVVDGKLKEQLGDFKKRHFQVELSSNKLVRLIFNGQVLQQDNKTLEGCGLFDNCVVHCLIHQRRTSPDDSDGRNEQSQSSYSRNTNQNNNNNNNQGRDWDLGNILFAIISFTLLSAWYFRYVYAHLYTVTATVGLILMTGVFTIVIFGFYFPDQEHLPPPPGTENSAGVQSTA